MWSSFFDRHGQDAGEDPLTLSGIWSSDTIKAKLELNTSADEARKRSSTVCWELRWKHCSSLGCVE